jgi:fructose-1,6-bisphosphatase/inositol monophosphatase family enzyme
VNYEKELAFAKALAREAGAIMHQNFVAGSTREWKGDSTPITVTDTTINTLVIQKVTKVFPEHNVIGEEENNDVGGDFTWVCDPVDGTMPFSHAVPISTFSLALTLEGKPVLGVVYDPFMDRMFYAVERQGAFLNDEPIYVSDNGLTHGLIDLEGFPSSKPVVQAGGEFAEKLHEKGASTMRLWSVILPSALVAAGQFTATIFNVTKPEDGAAIKVIVEEAGGKVTDLFGNEQRYDQNVKGFIASNGVVHQEIVDLLAKCPVV